MKPNASMNLYLYAASNPLSLSITYIMVMSDLYHILVILGKWYDGKGMGSKFLIAIKGINKVS
jgi:hypothetical protein